MTSYMGHHNESEIRREVDRVQWADLSKVQIEFDALGRGEALTDPIYFGRAYDRPPLMSYSVVAEASGSPSYPSVRPITWPHPSFVVGGCVDPYVKGVNTLRDPGFDLAGGGPNGNEIPSYEWIESVAPYTNHVEDFLVYSDGSRYGGVPGWYAGRNWPAIPALSLPRIAWQTDVPTEPANGSKHGASNVAGAANQTPLGLWAVGYKACAQYFGADWYPSARVEPGDTVTWSIYAKTTTTATVDFINIAWHNNQGGTISGVTDSALAMTTTYQGFSIAGVAPAGAYMAICKIQFAFSSGAIYVDNASVVVT